MRPTAKDIASYARMGRELLMVSEVKPGGRGTVPLRVVLCKITNGSYNPYVVWWEDMSDRHYEISHPVTFGGGYHAGSLSAVEEFRERAERGRFIVVEDER